MYQRPDDEIGFENVMNPSKMTGSQSEVGNRCILRSLPLRSVGTSSKGLPAILYDLTRHITAYSPHLLGVGEG